jgi:hypothetical protein
MIINLLRFFAVTALICATSCSYNEQASSRKNYAVSNRDVLSINGRQYQSVRRVVCAQPLETTCTLVEIKVASR